MAKIAVIGAGGLVGSKLTKILADKLPQHKIVLCGNSSVGTKVYTQGKCRVIQEIDSAEGCDYATFMADETVAKRYVPHFARNGTVCIDNSSAFRMQKGVPLVVPQINPQTIGCSKVIANPNCTTIQIAVVLSALLQFEPTAVNVVTMQSASGAGRDALADLTEKRSYGKLKSFPHPIFDNILPKVGDSLENGTTSEELKIKCELPKILSSSFPIDAFCTRVPITVGHCALVQLRFKKRISCEEISIALKSTENVLMLDDAANDVYPTPRVLRHTHYVGVGRIFVSDNGVLNVFTVADNLLLGAAYNAYKILEISMKNNGDWI